MEADICAKLQECLVVSRLRYLQHRARTKFFPTRTSEGGDLDALVELLAIHSQSIRLMKQALRRYVGLALLVAFNPSIVGC